MTPTLEVKKEELTPQESAFQYFIHLKNLKNVLQKLNINLSVNVNLETVKEFVGVGKTLGYISDVASGSLLHNGIVVPKQIIIEAIEGVSYDGEKEDGGVLHVGAFSTEEEILNVLKREDLPDLDAIIPDPVVSDPAIPIQEDPEERFRRESAEMNAKLAKSNSIPGMPAPLVTTERAESGSEEMNGIEVYTSGFSVEHNSKEDIENLKNNINGALHVLNEEELELLKSKFFSIFVGAEERNTLKFYDKTKKKGPRLEVGVDNKSSDIVNAIKENVIPKLKENVVDLSEEADDVSNIPVQEDGRILSWADTYELRLAEAESGFQKVEAKEEKYREKKGWRDKLNKIKKDANEIAIAGARGVGEGFNNVIGAGVDIFTRTVESDMGRKILANKVVKGYLKLNRTQRFAVNAGIIGLGTIIGTAIGGATATGALGYGGYRMARAAVSFGAATSVNAIGSWKERKLNKEFESKNKELNESNHSINQKEIYKETINKDYEVKKARLAKFKIGGTLAAGVGAGLLAGFAEHAFAGGTGGTAEATMSAKSKVSENIPIIKSPLVEAAMPVPVPKISEFLKPEDMKVDITKRDSVWGSIEKVMHKSEEFNSLAENQKRNVVANFVNIALKDPNQYGISDAKGLIHPGDTLDFSKLLNNHDNVQVVFEHAKNLKPQVNQIVDQVVTKPKLPTLEELQQKSLENGHSIGPTVVEPWDPGTPNHDDIYHFDVPDHTAPQIPTSTHPQVDGAEPMKSLSSAISDAETASNVESTVKTGINDIYGSKGFLGFGAKQGVDTEDWNMLKRLKMPDVLKYYQDDSTESKLPQNIIEALSKSDKHYNFMNRLDTMMTDSKGALKPFENESVEAFLKRSVGFMMKQVGNQAQNLTVA